MMGLSNKDLMRNFKDPYVQNYLKSTDSDERTQQLVNIYKARNYYIRF
jgi:aminoglycoside phosphotransferase family enzyme